MDKRTNERRNDGGCRPWHKARTPFGILRKNVIDYSMEVGKWKEKGNEKGLILSIACNNIYLSSCISVNLDLSAADVATKLSCC